MIDEDGGLVDLFNVLFGQDVLWLTEGKDRRSVGAPLSEEKRSFAERRCQVEIVGNRDDRQLVLLVLLLQDPKDFDLMTDVEMCVRLIKKQNLGLLAEGSRNQDTLALTAGYRCDEFISKVVDIRQTHHLLGNLQIMLVFESRPPYVRRPTHEDDFENSIRENPKCVLRDIGYPPCEIASAVCRQGKAVERDRSPLGDEDAVE